MKTFRITESIHMCREWLVDAEDESEAVGWYGEHGDLRLEDVVDGSVVKVEEVTR